MVYILREIAGWALLLFGIVLVWSAWGMVEDRKVFEAGAMVMGSAAVFRAAIFLLRISTAARLCMPHRIQTRPAQQEKLPPDTSRA